MHNNNIMKSWILLLLWGFRGHPHNKKASYATENRVSFIANAQVDLQSKVSEITILQPHRSSKTNLPPNSICYTALLQMLQLFLHPFFLLLLHIPLLRRTATFKQRTLSFALTPKIPLKKAYYMQVLFHFDTYTRSVRQKYVHAQYHPNTAHTKNQPLLLKSIKLWNFYLKHNQKPQHKNFQEYTS